MRGGEVSLIPGLWQNQHAVVPKARTAVVVVILSLAFTPIIPAFANNSGQSQDFIMNTRGVGHIDRGYVTSDQLLELGLPTTEALRLEGEQCLRTGETDRALTVLQKSVEMAPWDMEGRILYAAALGKKLAERDGKDNALFNFVVKQWLFVYKHTEFADQQVQALSNLYALTKEKPKKFESERKYLYRVLKPEEEQGAPPKVALQDHSSENKSESGDITASKKRSALDPSPSKN
jgi:hypothetical protein